MSSTPTKQIDGEVAIGRGVSIGGNAKVRGSVKVGHSLRVEGWLDAPNIKGPAKGLFRTGVDLKTAYPHPREGWWALVGDTLPAQVYIAHGGSWYAQTNEDGSAKTAGSLTIEASSLMQDVETLTDDVEELKIRVGDNESAISELQSGQKTQDCEIKKLGGEVSAAISTANEAKSSAAQAVETSGSALAAGQAAQAIAEHADETAEEANETAAQADLSARAAQTIAENANTTAAQAKNTAEAAADKAESAEAQASVNATHLSGLGILPLEGPNRIGISDEELKSAKGVYYDQNTDIFVGNFSAIGYEWTDYNETYSEGSGATAQFKMRARRDRVYRCGSWLYRVGEGRLEPLHQEASDEAAAARSTADAAGKTAGEALTKASHTAAQLAGLHIVPLDGIGITGDDIFPDAAPGIYWDTEDCEFIGRPDVNGYDQADYFVQDSAGEWRPRTDVVYSCKGALYHITDGQMEPLHQAAIDALTARVSTVETRLAGVAILPIDATVNLGTVAGAQQEGIRFDTMTGAFVGDFAAAGYAETDYNELYSESELVLPRWRARRDRIFRCGAELYRVEDGKLVKLHAGELAALRARVTGAENTLASLEVTAENIQEAVDTVYERVKGAGILPFDASYPLLGGKGVWFDSQNGKFAGDFSAHGYGEDAYNDKVEPEEGSLLPPERRAREDVIFRCGAELYRVEDGKLVRLFQGGSASVPGEADRITEDEIDALIYN